eukprot:TRINITY_DN9505_c0_g1_i1.p1 TRINITY_DN9505_c0_g1~~TRINITY_DN9505_c0_g1_i1.p1  ORF type:complete len:296 (+),score=34.23 TRINITY_DN9505_c0_g1_i1:46-933(+)
MGPFWFVWLLFVSTAAYDPVVCIGGFSNLGFAFENFQRYGDYFDATTELTLSETGTYQGVDDILEYVAFLSTASPYFAAVTNSPPVVHYLGSNSDDGCIFLFLLSSHRVTTPYLRSTEYEVAVMTKLFYSPAKNKVTRINVFYDQPYLAFFFDVMDTELTRHFVCSTMASPGCNYVFDANNYNSVEKCVKDLEKLPTTSAGYVDGKSKGCRYLHTVFAATNSVHCAHISYDPLADPNGKVKCQTSANTQPSSLFSAGDFAAFNNFKTENGYALTLGYKVIVPPTEPVDDGDSSDE